jgi:2-desacetyl-2-hydroxyethyl bacteriochlorophyllide A dehydrogenase
MNERSALYFTAPRQISLLQESLAPPPPGKVQVKTLFSAISPGTETMIYRGQFPKDSTLDASLPALSGHFTYPFTYGYASVGQVVAIGDRVDQAWYGTQVFAFQPHASHFNAATSQLLPLPDDLSPEEAIFLANMETAVNLVIDGGPLIGEHVLVCGQGIVGLLTSALLTRFPLASLISLDHYELRRQVSKSLGVDASLDPAVSGFQKEIEGCLPDGADLSYELSGSSKALDQVIALTGFNGRVLIGSWYGNQRASLDLGGDFHRKRIQMISSQVSTIAPQLSGRWNKARRFEVAWEMIRQVRPAQFITHKLPFDQAGLAYRLLDRHPEETIQVVFTYP